jgi:diguanylate cyclase (GGDEF)-like protein/PAS domain S-box-containing protein
MDLHDVERQFFTIVQNIPDAICVTGTDFIIRSWNHGAEDMLGYGADEIIGKHLSLIIPAEITQQELEHCVTALNGERKILAYESVRLTKDGRKIRVELSAVALNTGETVTGYASIMRDITDRKRIADELIGSQANLRRVKETLKRAYADLEIKVHERTRELAQANEELIVEIAERRRAENLIRKSKTLSDALNSLGTVIHSSLDIDEIMQRVVKGAAKAMNVDATLIGAFEDGVFRVRYVYNMPEAFTSRVLTPDELRAMHYAARAKDVVAFNDAFNDERLNIPFVREIGIRSLLVAPIMTKDRLIGAMVFYELSKRFEFGEERLDFARKLAASVSLALENAELYQALQENRKLAETRFAELRTVYETAPVGLCFIDRNMRYVKINRKLAEMNNVSIEETIGRTVREVIADEADRTIEDLCNRAIETGRPIENIEIRRKTINGMLTVLANYYPVRDQGNAVVGVNVVVQDITARKRTEDALRRSEQLLNAFLNSIPDIAWLKDREGRFILVNQPFGTAAGKDPDELIGKTDLEAWPRELAEKSRADDEEVMRSGTLKRVEEQLAPAGGPARWIETLKTPIYNEMGIVVGVAGIARDVTDRKRMEEEIRHMAQHDALTGLPNRRLFIDILQVELAQARRHRTKLAILFLDLDHFKEINDALGHEAGDKLLKEVSERFRSATRESDTVARIGGDEFNMILADISRIEDVSDIAVKIVDSLRKPIVIKRHELHVTTSVGISMYPDDSDDIQTLLRYADIAMYHAKESGRNAFRFFSPSINVKTIERMRLAGWLRQTIHRGELSVLYQPQIDIRSKKISYVEALVRWNHPERGLLEPRDFIPLAEETGFITSIDEWVLRTVCLQAASWKKAGVNSFCVAVNLSARQFQSPDLVKMVAAVLAKTGLPPGCLDLEVTESTAMNDVEQSASQLRELRDMGVHISIDDFGTGYSSLNYLKKLPIERLKIDRSFIQDIVKDSDDRAIIGAVTSMAHKMGIKTVAEGVETEEQLAFLRDSDCDEAQGFLFSRPVSAKQFQKLVQAGNRSKGL